MKRKAPTQTKLKKNLDKEFSIYIRLKYSDANGYSSCYTCHAQKHYKELQCGHFVPRGCLRLRYDERNVRVQCAGCNIWGRGRVADFGARLERESPGITAQLFRESQEIVHDFPYQKWIEHYKELNKNGQHITS